MKKVAEAAEELDVARSTVYKYLKKMAEELEPYIDEEEGVTVIEEDGIEIIRTRIQENKRKQQGGGSPQPEDENDKRQSGEGKAAVSSENEQEIKQRVDKLEDQVEELQEQLKKRNEQLKDQMDDIVDVTNTLYEFTDHLDQKLSEMKEFKDQSLLERVKNLFGTSEQE